MRGGVGHSMAAVRRLWSRGKAVCVTVVAAAMVGSLVGSPPALADPPSAGPSGAAVRSEPVEPSRTDGPGVTRVDDTALPWAGSAVVAVPSAGVSVGGLPVALTAATPPTDEPLRPGRRVSAQAAAAGGAAGVCAEGADRAELSDAVGPGVGQRRWCGVGGDRPGRGCGRRGGPGGGWRGGHGGGGDVCVVVGWGDLDGDVAVADVCVDRRWAGW